MSMGPNSLPRPWVSSALPGRITRLAQVSVPMLAMVIGCSRGLTQKSSVIRSPIPETGNGTVLPTRNLSTDGRKSSALIDPSARTSLRVDAAEDSAISGASLVVPPGSLAIDGSAVTVSMEQGADVATGSSLSELGLEDSASTIQPAGPAVVVSTDVAIDASQPLTLSIDLSSAFGLLNGASAFAFSE